jgi:hypothetical protein
MPVAVVTGTLQADGSMRPELVSSASGHAVRGRG